MNSKRVYYLQLGLIGFLLILTFSSLFFGEKLLKKQTEKLINAKLDNRVLEEQQVALVQANKDIQKYSELEAIAKTIVPKDKDQARVIRELVVIADQSGIPIQSISFPSSSLGQTTKPAVKTTDSDAPPAAMPLPSQLNKVDGLSTVYRLEISLQSTVDKPVTFDQLVSFLQRLENNRRTAQVSNINITPEPKNRNLVTFSLKLDVYIKP